VLSLWECLPGEEETTFVSPSAVMARVGDRQLTIHQKNNESACLHNDLRGKDVVFVENPTSGASYEALVVTESADNIRVEMSLSEVCTLPDGREIKIYSLEIVSPSGVELEYQTGGGGWISAELITADGNSVELSQEDDENSGDVIVTVG